MATTTLLLLLSLIPLSLLPFSSPLPADAVLNAAEILSNSGYVSMSLTLQLISPSLTTIPQTTSPSSQPPPPRAATIFSPSDSAFAASGQPSLSLLHLHFSPLAFSLETLRSLPYATRIPTLSPGNSLVVTTPDPTRPVSLNNVTITGSPIFDDGSLIVFGIDAFFDPHFVVPPRIHVPIPSFRCLASQTTPTPSFTSYSFAAASRVLRSREYSVMASCLDLQLPGLLHQQNLTVFAPVDDVLVDLVHNFSDYAAVFRQHVVPCRLTWTDLRDLEEGAVLRTFDDGFAVAVAKANGELVVNGVPVAFPDMYSSDWLVVHGLRPVNGEAPETSPEFGGEERIEPDRNEF
ncbi:hypothetical protein RHGRI_026790 [Rhododendron griersonianum]|uniref:FAS1 domain-containing protein n=1 Tax=Rhododendron griersonianum TaxID=479676 RepID=A0AAV6IXZ0_9ERIC|nr:hypothetical protein RHGRI_026790 [Rhododendron griersonianum]